MAGGFAAYCMHPCCKIMCSFLAYDYLPVTHSHGSVHGSPITLCIQHHTMLLPLLLYVHVKHKMVAFKRKYLLHPSMVSTYGQATQWPCCFRFLFINNFIMFVYTLGQVKKTQLPSIFYFAHIRKLVPHLVSNYSF